MAAPELGGFRLLEGIAEGGLSTVWRARHATGITAAVKILRTFGTPDEADRFRREIRAVARLSHPGIVSVLDLGHATADLILPGGQEVRAGAPWLAMEHVGGGTVRPDHVREAADLVAVARSLLEALAHAHARGVLHRDLKPQNVLLSDPRRANVGLKLTDFGIAWTRSDTNEHGPSGTLAYMAPEQIEVESRRYGPWTDLYGLGCLLWELATGAPPFADRPGRPLAMAQLLEDPPPLAARFEDTAGLETWLRRLLAKEPGARFATAPEALRALVGDPGPRTDPPPTRSWSRSVAGAGLRLFGLRDAPMVGRTEAKDTLLKALADAGEGPVVVVVRGAEGVGRSRLLRWLHEWFEESGEASTTLLGPEALGRDLRRELLAKLGGEGLEGEALREHLTWRLGHAAVDPDLRQELVDVLEPPPGRVVERDNRNQVVARWLALTARSGRVAWIVDDADRAPEAVQVATALVRHRAAPALVVLGLADGRGLPETGARPGTGLSDQARDLRLEPLPREDRLVLLQRWLVVEPQLAARLDEETGGNTLLTIELLRDHVERGWLVPGLDGLTLAPGRGVVVPSDRLAPWRSRVERVVGDDDEREVQLELAAALGEEVSAAAWDAVGGEEEHATRRRLLDGLYGARLAEPTAAGFRFAHPMVRNAVLRRARVQGRFKDAHRTCLAWARRVGAAPERVAAHLVALEDWDEAVTPLLDAAFDRHHREGPAGATETADLAEQALQRAGVDRADPRWCRLHVLRAALLEARGRPEESLAVLEDLEPRLDTLGDTGLRCRARHAHALALTALGRHDEAWFLHLRNADESALPTDLRVQTFDALVILAFRQGRLDEASAWAERAEQLHREAGDEGQLAVSLTRQAVVAAMRHQLDAAHALLDRAEPLVARSGSLKQRRDLVNDRADLHRAAGRYDLAEPLLVRAIELSHASGYLPVIASLNLAVCKLEQQRLDEAEAVIHESRATTLRPETFGSVGASLILAICHASRARWSAFDRSIDRAAIGLALHADDDFVRLLDRAAGACDAQAQVARAARCRTLSRQQADRRSGT